MELESNSDNTIDNYINLSNLLKARTYTEAQDDFLTFVRLVAPSLVSDWKMGKHIEVISNKLDDLEKVI